MHLTLQQEKLEINLRTCTRDDTETTSKHQKQMKQFSSCLNLAVCCKLWVGAFLKAAKKGTKYDCLLLSPGPYTFLSEGQEAGGLSVDLKSKNRKKNITGHATNMSI